MAWTEGDGDRMKWSKNDSKGRAIDAEARDGSAATSKDREDRVVKPQRIPTKPWNLIEFALLVCELALET